MFIVENIDAILMVCAAVFLGTKGYAKSADGSAKVVRIYRFCAWGIGVCGVGMLILKPLASTFQQPTDDGVAVAVFPAPPKTEFEPWESAAGMRTNVNYSTELPSFSASLVLTRTPIASAERAMTDEEVFAAILNAAISQGRKVVGRSQIDCGKAGVEVVFHNELAKEQIVLRVARANTNAYTVQAVFPLGSARPLKAQQFLDSFRIIGHPAHKGVSPHY